MWDGMVFVCMYVSKCIIIIIASVYCIVSVRVLVVALGNGKTTYLVVWER